MADSRGCKFEDRAAFENPCFACKYGNGQEDMRNPKNIIEIPEELTQKDFNEALVNFGIGFNKMALAMQKFAESLDGSRTKEGQ